MTTMTYEGYIARLEIDVEAGEIHGEVVNTKAVLTFAASSVEELAGAFRDTIEEYKAWCAERGEPAERPYSGNLSLRISPQLHRELAGSAAERSLSINAYVSTVIEAALVAPSPTTIQRSFVFNTVPSPGDAVVFVGGSALQATLATGPTEYSYTQLAGPIVYSEPIELPDALQKMFRVPKASTRRGFRVLGEAVE